MEEPITAVGELAGIPISFEVGSVFDVSARDGGLGALVLSERRLDVPYVKDYDTMEGERPAQWAARFDVSNWGMIGAHSNGARVGGAVIAFNTAGVNMLKGRSDLAVLWDIRVSPEARGRGVGAARFRLWRHGPPLEAAGSSRSRRRTSTWRRADFTPDRGVSLAPSTASLTETSLTKFSCSGTRTSYRRPFKNGGHTMEELFGGEPSHVARCSCRR